MLRLSMPLINVHDLPAAIRLISRFSSSGDQRTLARQYAVPSFCFSAPSSTSRRPALPPTEYRALSAPSKLSRMRDPCRRGRICKDLRDLRSPLRQWPPFRGRARLPIAPVIKAVSSVACASLRYFAINFGLLRYLAALKAVALGNCLFISPSPSAPVVSRCRSDASSPDASLRRIERER